MIFTLWSGMLRIKKKDEDDFKSGWSKGIGELEFKENFGADNCLDVSIVKSDIEKLKRENKQNNKI